MKLRKQTRYLILCGMIILITIAFSYALMAKRNKTFPAIGNKWVAVTTNHGVYQLYRNGHPYFIRGADIGSGKWLDDIRKAGANSVHIYNTEHTQEILDSAQSLGLTVTIGLYMGVAGKDIDYSNDQEVSQQLNRLKAEVLKYKNHPALLMWGVGNETNLFLKEGLLDLPDHIRVNKAINSLARMIHQVDSNHPTVMMVTGGSQNRISSFICDQVDIIAYNSFEPFAGQIKKSYWNGPYIVSEFGQPAYWISPQTAWYKYLEPSSLEKMQFMDRQYKAFTADKNCLGSYAFYWDQKQEYTATWFSLYTKNGEPTDLTEKLHSLWAGSPMPAINQIKQVFLNGREQTANIYLKQQKQYPVSVLTTLPVNNSTRLSWEIETDSRQEFNLHLGMERLQSTVDSGIVSEVNRAANMSHELQFSIQTPSRNGPYRLFLYLKSESGKTATASVCFYVHD